MNRIAAVVALGLLAVASRAAQSQEVIALLPDSAAERLVAFHNMEAMTRLSGDAHIGAGTVVQGGVVVLGGSLVIEGTVEGDVVVINGDLTVTATAGIAGNVIVAGGDVTIEGRVGGDIRVYRESLRYRHVGAAIEYVPPDLEVGLSAGRDFAFGRTDVRVAAYTAYNRAEGLPIAVGPRVRLGATHPLSARVLLIARTAVPEGVNHDRIGYDVDLEQMLASRLGLSVGIGAHSVVSAIEPSGLTDRESALATFVLHTDYRDQYERRGWAAFARLERPGAPYSVSLTYRDEVHARAGLANPTALATIHNSWRPQPSMAEGALHSIDASIRYDTRNERVDPTAGWLIDAGIEKGLGGSLVNPGAFHPDSADAFDRDARDSFTAGRVDVRRYARLSPYARLALRVVAAGSIDGRPLPPQRQHTLGGEGSLPGYRLFEFDCGARANSVEIGGNPYYPYYGCDRMALVQIEYQASFPYARRVSEALGLSGSLGYLARWVVFFDAGRAWNEPGAGDGRFGGNADFSVDAGLGLRLGPVGAYWAVPLSGHGHGFNVFVRLSPRF